MYHVRHRFLKLALVSSQTRNLDISYLRIFAIGQPWQILQKDLPRLITRYPINEIMCLLCVTSSLCFFKDHFHNFQEIAERLTHIEGDVVASVPMTDFIKGYQTHKYMLPK
jgi:hypothetical protein